jgi:predicted hydrocarbon binding protein
LQASSPRKAAGYDLRRLVGSVNQLRFNDNKGEVSFFGQKMIILRRDVIRIMREALERLVGDQSGPFLSYLASGIGVHEGSIFRESIGTTGPETRPQLENLVHSALEDTNLGLGKVRINTIDFDKTSADITIANCFEATENGPSEEPNCIFTSGFLAGIFAEVLDKTVQAKETKCMSKGAPECEFQISMAETSDGEGVEKPNVDMKQVDTSEAAKGEAKPGTSGGSTDSKSAIGAPKGTSDDEVDLSDTEKMDAGAEKAARIAKHKQHFWNRMKKS